MIASVSVHAAWKRRDLRGLPPAFVRRAQARWRIRQRRARAHRIRDDRRRAEAEQHNQTVRGEEKTIAGRVRARIAAWRRIGAPRRVLRWIARGVPVRWSARGPPRPFRLPPVHFADDEQQQWFLRERDRLFACGAWRPGTVTTHVSPAFLVAKPPEPDGQANWRVVVNLKRLNASCAPLRTRYESLRTLRTIAARGEYAFAWDIKDGYYHLMLAPEYQHYMTFAVLLGGQIEYITCVGLPMGWTHSAYYFVHLMRVFVRHLRAPEVAEQVARMRELRAGQRPEALAPARDAPPPHLVVRMRVLAYVDDFLGICPSMEAGLEAMARADALMLELGILKHPRKFTPEPVQRLDHLGLEVDLAEGRFRVTAKRAAKLRAMAKDLLCRAARKQRWVPARALAQMAGTANSCLLAVLPARFFLRAIFVALESRSSWAGNCRLDRQALRDLAWWADFQPASRWNGAPIWKPPLTAELHCDAAGGARHGWGGVLNGRATARGTWTPTQASLPITLLELKAVRFSVESFLAQLRGRVVRLHEDNMGVVGILAAGRSRSPRIMDEMRKLWWLLDANDILIRGRYIRSEDNVVADALSRMLPHPHLRPLRASAVRFIERRWGREHTVDRFATYATSVAPRYCAVGPHREPRAEPTDAFGASWHGETNFARPPPDAISRVVRLLQRQPGVSATVVVPYWAGAAWFAPLMELARDTLVLPWRELELPWLAGGATRAWNAVVVRVGPDRPGST